MNYCLFHANCYDGLMAAYSVWKKYRVKDWTYIPVQYGEEPPDMPNADNIVITDFSYKKEILNKLIEKCNFLTILDHHKTAQQDLQDFINDKVLIIFDMTRSGCVITWNEMFYETEIPELLLYAQDRDLWTWKLEDSKEINEALRMDIKLHEDNIRNFQKIDYIIQTWNIQKPHYMVMGATILEYKNELVESIASKAVSGMIPGYDKEVMIVNSCIFQSEIGNYLNNQGHEIACIYFDQLEIKKRIFSLRGKGSDVIAKTNGGGGHFMAAGFSIPLENL